jgi:hypothetical protein
METQMLPIEPIQGISVKSLADCLADVIRILDIFEKFRPLIGLKNVSEVLIRFIP